VHYRAPLNFTWEGMEEARAAIARVDEWTRRLGNAAREAPGSKSQAPKKLQALSSKDEFRNALDDDLNISEALGVLFETIRETNRRMDLGEVGAEEAEAWLEWWKSVDGVLQISGEEAELPREIAALAEARVQARLAKDWRKSDELRDELAAHGWEARDTKDGQKITRRGGA
jgi:cysteinyl-tRNA synthetase